LAGFLLQRHVPLQSKTTFGLGRGNFIKWNHSEGKGHSHRGGKSREKHRAKATLARAGFSAPEAELEPRRRTPSRLLLLIVCLAKQENRKEGSTVRLDKTKFCPKRIGLIRAHAKGGSLIHPGTLSIFSPQQVTALASKSVKMGNEVPVQRWTCALSAATTCTNARDKIVTLCRPPPHQDWGRARTAGSRFARDDKEPGPSWG
jgi:hypothetical protein